MTTIVGDSSPYDWTYYIENKEELVLSDLNLNTEAIVSLAKALKNNGTVQCIDLTGSKIEEDGASSLAEALRMSPSIAKGKGVLYLSANNISNVGINTLFKVVEETNRSPECIRLISPSN